MGLPNKDEIKGKAKTVKGHIKEAAGDLTDNERLKAEGKTDRVKGKIQEKYGEFKNAADDLADSIKD